jgi:hypothetical protein
VLVTNLKPTTNATTDQRVSETAGAKLRRRKGNSPDHQLRSLSIAQCERESFRPNSQDVGLEAAIIERVRNSSLVEWRGTDNVSRLKQYTEAMDTTLSQETGYGRGAFSKPEKPDCKDWWRHEK